jgi:hypothetical protein
MIQEAEVALFTVLWMLFIGLIVGGVAGKLMMPGRQPGHAV